MATTERDALLKMVQMFAFDPDNRCWSTAKRWSLKEAKEVLRTQSQRAEAERRAEQEPA